MKGVESMSARSAFFMKNKATKIVDKIKYAIDNHQLLKVEDRVVVAVSGGPDSMALLHFLVNHCPELKLQLIVVHINHCLRGEEADQEAAFVQKRAAEWGVPAEIHRIEVGVLARDWKCSVQEAARRARYQLLEKVANLYRCQRIAVAHHADDQVETILENFLRGSGLSGLAGMYYRRGSIIRPFLGLTRDEIEVYLQENQIPFCLDSSNLKTVYLRNRIRLELLPFLKKEYNPNLISGLNRMADILRDENDLLERLAQETKNRCLLYEGIERYSEEDMLLDEIGENKNNQKKEGINKDKSVVLSIPHLLKEPLALQRRVIRLVLGDLGESLREFSYQHVDSLLELATNPVGGRKVYLPQNLQGRRDGHQLIIELRKVRLKKKKSYN